MENSTTKTHKYLFNAKELREPPISEGQPCTGLGIHPSQRLRHEPGGRLYTEMEAGVNK